jgi:hypothetical protein
VFAITPRDKSRQPRPRQEPVKHLLRDSPCYGGVSQPPLPGNRPGTVALGDALASDAPLQLGQLGLATHVDPSWVRNQTTALGDPVATQVARTDR